MADVFSKCHSFTRDREALAAGIYPYFKPIAALNGPRVVVDGREMIMVGSNNYLGLTTHPKVRQAAMDALDALGTSCSGSRFLNGTLELHEQLEAHLARFCGKEAAQVFSTGFQTMQGVIAPLVSRNDNVIMDRLVHASIVDGVRLSFGKPRRFMHNDMESLRRNLERCPTDQGIIIVVDGVYSMDGDLAPLPEITNLAKEFGARMMVDDAHGLGVLGANGRGVLEHFGLIDEVDLVMGTFSKSLASLGGFVAGDERVISYIRHHSRALIFSAAMPPSAIAAVDAALHVIETEPEIRANLWRNTEFFLDGVRSLGFQTGDTSTPVVPLVIGDDFLTLYFWKRLFEEGLFTNCVLSPAVPDGSQRIRTSLMATHTIEDLEIALETLQRVGRELGILQ
ncbi:MAG: aminotransferase class I/II-fold pyridoxal phosphate-dependent enzyme [Thermodesulfobacteriota bacterium]